MLRALLLPACALLLIAPAIAQERSEQQGAQRYQIQFSIVEGEHTVASLHTQATTESPVEAALQSGGVEWAFHATLVPTDEAGQMLLEAQLSSGAETVAAPRLTFARNEAAGIRIGGPDRLISLEIKPVG